MGLFGGLSKEEKLALEQAKSYLQQCDFNDKELALLKDAAIIEFAGAVRQSGDTSACAYSEAKRRISKYMLGKVREAVGSSGNTLYTYAITSDCNTALRSYFKKPQKLSDDQIGHFFNPSYRYEDRKFVVRNPAEADRTHGVPVRLGYFGRHRIFRDALIGVGIFAVAALIAVVTVYSLGLVPAVVAAAGGVVAGLSGEAALGVAAGIGIVGSALLSSTVGLLGRGVRSIYRGIRDTLAPSATVVAEPAPLKRGGSTGRLMEAGVVAVAEPAVTVAPPEPVVAAPVVTDAAKPAEVAPSRVSRLWALGSSAASTVYSYVPSMPGKKH